jgi:hypothetical protein
MAHSTVRTHSLRLILVISLPPFPALDAPGAVAARGDVQKDEAKEYGELATVLHRKEAARRVCLKVGHSHFSARHELHQAAENVFKGLNDSRQARLSYG